MKRLHVSVVCVTLLALATMIGPAHAAQSESRTGGPKRSGDVRTARLKPAIQAQGVFPRIEPSELECLAKRRPRASNVLLDCDDPDAPKNEPDLEVDPENPRHMIASSNDYESCCDQFYTSFNRGNSWWNGDMSTEGPNRIGSDPVTVFDTKHETTIHSSLNFLINEEGEGCDGDLVVSISRDGGLHWPRVVVVADGIGCDSSPLQVFHDKEWIVTDNNPDSPYYGRTYLTWTAFISRRGEYRSSPILESHSDDGGFHWSRPKRISGFSARYCTYQEAGPSGACDEDQFSVPTVGPDGTVYVAFQNFQHEAAWERGDLFESQYMVVRSRDGGRTFSRPRHVADLEDGTRDYPENVDGRQTLTGVQFRVNSAGNIVAHPRTGRLYLVFSDNRAGRHDVRHPVTNTNVYIMTSRDRGRSWRGPFPVSVQRGDQWFPWVEADPTSRKIGVLYHEETSQDPWLYDTSFSEGNVGSFDTRTVSTKPSHPNNSLWFRAGVRECPRCATFIGDYINLSYGTDGKANLAWTDMRRFRKIPGFRRGYTENIFFARV